MTVNIEWNGINHTIDFDTAVSMMDDGLREYVHHKEAPCTEQHFIDVYCDAHYDQFGEEFVVF